MMMEQMKNCMNNRNQANDNNKMIIQRNKNCSECLTVIFRNYNSGSPIQIQCLSTDRVEEIIKRYRCKSNDQDNSKKFIFNAKELNPDLTAAEAGLSNNANIFIVKIKDEIKYKSNEDKTISFTSSNGNKIILQLNKSTKVCEAIKLYSIKIMEEPSHHYFLFNQEMINIDDQRTIEKAFPGNDINIIVINLGNVIGA